MIKIGYLVSGHSKDEDLSSSLSYLDDAQPKRVEPIDDDELKYHFLVDFFDAQH